MLPLRNTGKKNRKEKKKRKEIDYLPPAGESRGHVGGHSLAVHVGGHSLDVPSRATKHVQRKLRGRKTGAGIQKKGTDVSTRKPKRKRRDCLKSRAATRPSARVLNSVAP